MNLVGAELQMECVHTYHIFKLGFKIVDVPSYMLWFLPKVLLQVFRLLDV